MPPRDEGAVSLYIGHELRDVKGKIKSKGKKLGHSFVDNFARYLYMRMGQRQVVFYLPTGSLDTAYTSTDNSATMNFTAGGSGDSSRGLCIGTSSTAESVSDYNLGSKIIHGTSSGQMQYSSTTYSNPITDATSTSFNITRVFTNGSSGSITVREIGLFATNLASSNILMARDLLSPSVSVGVGEQLTINYTIKVTI